MSLTILIVQITWSSTDHAIPGTYKSLIFINCEGRTNPSPELQRVQLQALFYRALVLVPHQSLLKVQNLVLVLIEDTFCPNSHWCVFPLPCCFYCYVCYEWGFFRLLLEFRKIWSLLFWTALWPHITLRSLDVRTTAIVPQAVVTNNRLGINGCHAISRLYQATLMSCGTAKHLCK